MTACPRLLFLGGNGHCAARLEPARRVLRDAAERTGAPPFDLVEIAYPGFEGRPRASGLPEFLDAVGRQLVQAARGDQRAPAVVYGTGIGGLLALCLRARGEIRDLRLLFQAPVLWGLERRLMPALMRLGPARAAAARLFASRAFQAWFRRRYLPPSLDPVLVRGFHGGYAQCAALPDLFQWLSPALLRRLEASLAAQGDALEGIAVWWGGRDRVVTPEELRLTEKALGVTWPLRRFESWGHYPMLEDPRGWVEALVSLLRDS